MISTSFILSTGLKKWMPTNFSGRRLALARPVIGRVEVLLAKNPPGAQHGLGFLRDPRLQFAVLEHGFDDEVASLKTSTESPAVMRESRASWSCGSSGPCRPGLRHLDAVVAAGFGFLQGHVLQHGGTPRLACT
jgi:hypothetical protein